MKEICENGKSFEELIKKYNTECELLDRKKAIIVLEISKIYAKTHIKERDFRTIIENNQNITHNDIIRGIEACKIEDISNYTNLGWSKIRNIIENTHKHKLLKLKDVEKEFGSLNDEHNMQTFLIKTKLKCDRLTVNGYG